MTPFLHVKCSFLVRVGVQEPVESLLTADRSYRICFSNAAHHLLAAFGS